ncbi:hypothetical protein Goshw_008139 [Gossypium schwendimanii]|uniref:DUF4283 domain-containing protein n=1 Tax=Gossypium schwendimanii TaxID=34291 RepID=A0A7J9L1R3_GOSSC|nr:hypothetical protein [Gossypium schwendimanii]
MASSSLTSLEDKATKKVHMRNNGLGEDDHLMVVDEGRNPNEFDKLSNSRLSFKDMLLGLSRDANQSLHDQDNKDLQLLDGDVITRTEDELLSIRFSKRPSTLFKIMDLENDYFMVKFQVEMDYIQMVAWIRLPSIPNFLYWKSILTSIGETIGHVTKLDDNTGNMHRGRFVHRTILFDLNKPLLSKIKVDGVTPTPDPITRSKYDVLQLKSQMNLTKILETFKSNRVLAYTLNLA